MKKKCLHLVISLILQLQFLHSQLRGKNPKKSKEWLNKIAVVRFLPSDALACVAPRINASYLHKNSTHSRCTLCPRWNPSQSLSLVDWREQTTIFSSAEGRDFRHWMTMEQQKQTLLYAVDICSYRINRPWYGNVRTWHDVMCCYTSQRYIRLLVC